MREGSKRVKILIMVISLIVIFYLLSTLLIIPDIQKQEKAQSKLASLNIDLKNLQEKKKELFQKLLALKEYETFLSYCDKKLEPKDIRALLELYSNVEKIEKVLTEKKEKIVTAKYRAIVLIDSPTDFYNILDKINSSSLLIKLDYPLFFKKKGAKIEVFLTIITLSLEG